MDTCPDAVQQLRVERQRAGYSSHGISELDAWEFISANGSASSIAELTQQHGRTRGYWTDHVLAIAAAVGVDDTADADTVWANLKRQSTDQAQLMGWLMGVTDQQPLTEPQPDPALETSIENRTEPEPAKAAKDAAPSPPERWLKAYVSHLVRERWGGEIRKDVTYIRVFVSGRTNTRTR